MRCLIPLAAALPIGLAAPAPAAATGPTVPAAGSAFVAKLDQLPASFLNNESVILSYVDMNLLWERFGVGTDPAERLEAIGRLAEAETYSLAPELFGASLQDIEGARSEIGFSAFEIDREASLIAPPHRVIVADTSVPATTIADAVATDPLWSADLTEVDSDAGPYWTWGDDPVAQDLMRRTPMRYLGQRGAVAVVGDAPATLIRTLHTEDVEATMRAAGSTDASVADEGPFAATVEAFGDAEVVQAQGTTTMATYMPPPIVGHEVDIDEIAESLDSAIRFRPYSSVTLVEIVDDGVYRTEIVVNHLDPAIADANAKIAATWLADGVDTLSALPIADLLPGATVTVDGSLVRVSLAAGSFIRAFQMLHNGALFPA